MDKICATCGRWDPEDQSRRPIELRRLNSGKCPYKGETKCSENCWCWKLADQEELDRRGYGE